MKAITLILLVILAQTAQADQITIIANSIDTPLNRGFMDALEAQGHSVGLYSAGDLDAVKGHNLIIILGGHRAPEGVGEIVDDILTDREKDYLLSDWGSKKLSRIPDVWSEGQTVVVLAGHGKAQTRDLAQTAQADLLRGLRFNDSISWESIDSNARQAIIPPIEPNQPFTEVDAHQAKAIIDGPGDVIIVDVRAGPYYERGRIPEAVNLYERKLHEVIGGLDKDKTYLLYCGGNSEAINAGNYMSQQGFTRVYRLVDGYVAWRRAGYSRETG
jgi:rhodanese-related sulfurtransferase